MPSDELVTRFRQRVEAGRVSTGGSNQDRGNAVSDGVTARRRAVRLDSGVAHIAWQLQRIKGELRRRPTKTVSSEAPLPLRTSLDVGVL